MYANTVEYTLSIYYTINWLNAFKTLLVLLCTGHTSKNIKMLKLTMTVNIKDIIFIMNDRKLSW